MTELRLLVSAKIVSKSAEKLQPNYSNAHDEKLTALHRYVSADLSAYCGFLFCSIFR